MMLKYIFILFVLQAVYYAEVTAAKRKGLKRRAGQQKTIKKDVKIPVDPSCKAIKCDPVTAPICTEMNYKVMGGSKTNYVMMVNKCEMNFVNCHSGVTAKIVPMENCEKQNGRKRFKSKSLRSSNPQIGKKTKQDVKRTAKKRVVRPVSNKRPHKPGKRRPKRDISDNMVLDPHWNARRVDPVNPASSKETQHTEQLMKPKNGNYKLMAKAEKLKLKDLLTDDELLKLESGLITKLKADNDTPLAREAVDSVKKLFNTSKNEVNKPKKEGKTLSQVLGALSDDISDETEAPNFPPMRQKFKQSKNVQASSKEDLKDIISKDELFELLGDGLKKLDENKDGSNTIVIDNTTKNKSVNKPVKNPANIKKPYRQKGQMPFKSRPLKGLKPMKNSVKSKLSRQKLNGTKNPLGRHKIVNDYSSVKKLLKPKVQKSLRGGDDTEGDSAANNKKEKRSGDFEYDERPVRPYPSKDDELTPFKPPKSDKIKQYTFLLAEYQGKLKSLWISKKDYYKLRRMIKGLTPEDEVFNPVFFFKREKFEGEPPKLQVQGKNAGELLNKGFQAVAVERISEKRYRAVLINQQALDKVKRGQASHISDLSGTIDIKDLPSTYRNPERRQTISKEGSIYRPLPEDLKQPPSTVPFFVVGFPIEEVDVHTGVLDDVLPDPMDDYDEVPQGFTGGVIDVADIDGGEPYEIEDDGIPDLVGQFEDEKNLTDEVDLDQYTNTCPTKCPIRTQMVCARCGEKIYRTFQSVCHMRMFACNNNNEKLQLVAREPCALSVPYLNDNMRIPDGRLTEPNDDDVVLRFVKCRSDFATYGHSSDPRCDLNHDYYKFVYPPSEAGTNDGNTNHEASDNGPESDVNGPENEGSGPNDKMSRPEYIDYSEGYNSEHYVKNDTEKREYDYGEGYFPADYGKVDPEKDLEDDGPSEAYYPNDDGKSEPEHLDIEYYEPSAENKRDYGKSEPESARLIPDSDDVGRNGEKDPEKDEEQLKLKGKVKSIRNSKLPKDIIFKH